MNNTVRRSSRLIRLGLSLLLILAVLAVAGLIYEFFNFAQSMPDRGWNWQVFRLIAWGVANLVVTALLVTLALLYLWSRYAKSLPDLKGWHLQKPDSEFCAADAKTGYTLDDYMNQEDRIFKELDEMMAGDWAKQSPGAYSRFNADSVCNPETISDRNWNRSLVLPAENPIGGVLLVHGLSDSPYSLRSIGRRLHAQGYTVVWLRVPGHGTNPRALAEVSWVDWTAAVKVAVQGLRERLPADIPLILGGYSNGGGLSVHYALSAIEDKSLPKPDAIVLFSPMIGINPLARITRLYHIVGLVSRNQKARWSSIFAEIDPYKFSSWPMNANVQAWNVTQAVERKLSEFSKAGRMHEMPPVLAMQSVVDSTVVVHKLITVLFDRLESESSELCLFDVNRVDWLGNLLNLSFEKSVLPKLERADRPYRLTVLQNATADSQRLKIRSRDGGKWVDQKVELDWPDGIVSLSHVAVPIPSEDPIYGSGGTNPAGLSLGTLSMRAEPSALMVPGSLFVRCRYNPFYQFMEDHIVGWLSKTIVTPLGEVDGKTNA